MRNDIYLKTGIIFYGVSIFAIGIIHIATHNFPAGLLPVAASLPGRVILVYLSGIAMIIAGVLIVIKRCTGYGAFLAAIIFLVFLLFLHIPKLITNPGVSSEWTFAFEVFMLFSGALILSGIYFAGSNHKISGHKLIVIGKYIFATSLFVFAVLHYLFTTLVITFIPPWIPWRLFWAYFVMCAFFAASLSLFIQKLVRLSATLLSLMFFLWVCLLHLPLVVANYSNEPAWTNLFVPLAMSGIGLLIAATTSSKSASIKV